MSFSVPGALFDGPHGQVSGAQGSGFRVQGSEFRSFPFPCNLSCPVHCNHLNGVGTAAEGKETHRVVQGQACTATRGGRGAYFCGSVAFGRIPTLLRRRTWLFEERRIQVHPLPFVQMHIEKRRATSIVEWHDNWETDQSIIRTGKEKVVRGGWGAAPAQEHPQSHPAPEPPSHPVDVDIDSLYRESPKRWERCGR